MAKSTDSTSRPPRPPATSRSVSNTSNPSGVSPRPLAGVDGDSNFVNDDWDESFEDSPVKPSGKKSLDRPQVVTGSRPDNNWLEDDFDD